jgi:signal transduction histidine kinase
VTEADDFRRAPLPADLDRLLHDLRGPLNAAVMHLEVVKRLLGDDPTGRESLRSIQQEMERLAGMLPVAVSICALEIHHTVRVSLRAVVDAAMDDVMRKHVVVSPDPWPDIDGDERLLVIAVRQLLLNALEAGGVDGEAHVSVETGPDATVVLVVRDSGPGFGARNASARVRLMAGGKAGHLGIGLLVALRVARLHEGSLTFGTGDGGGVVRLALGRGRA